MMSCEQALALKVQLNLSDKQYQILRNSSLQQHANIYPTLHEILKVKDQCYPENLIITETSALCSLQSMADHTLSRIIELSVNNLNDFSN